MLEKTGTLLLTEEELIQIKSGDLPPRIGSEWGLSLSELQGIIETGNYSKIGGRLNKPRPLDSVIKEIYNPDSDSNFS